jgi:hypothetical protein
VLGALLASLAQQVLQQPIRTATTHSQDQQLQHNKPTFLLQIYHLLLVVVNVQLIFTRIQLVSLAPQTVCNNHQQLVHPTQAHNKLARQILTSHGLVRHVKR